MVLQIHCNIMKYWYKFPKLHYRNTLIFFYKNIPLTRNYYVQYIREMSTVYRMFVFASLKSTKYSNTTKKYLLPYVCSSNRSTTLHFFSNDWECTKLTPCSDFAFLVFQTILKTSIQTPYEPNLNFWGSYLWRYFHDFDKAAQLANIFSFKKMYIPCSYKKM